MKLHFPEPQSLKEKRFVLKSVVTRLRDQFNASIAELDGMDLWQSSVIAAACVGREKKEVERLLGEIMNFLDRQEHLRVVDHQKELL